ncbi:MAG: M61 family peptidase, partial [Bryobacteraceae bacterium]
PDEYRQGLALDAARMDVSPGRRWRPLIDTAVAAPILYGTRPDRSSLRRGVDFYPEGALIWLDADVTIRTLSHGKKSLDDFCSAFFGGPSGPPEVKPYTLNDVLSALNAIQPYDWAKFFDERIKQVAPRAPLGGIEGGGWRLVYKEKLPPMMEWQEQESKGTNLVWSIGLSLREDGTVIDSLTGMPADRAGVAPGTQVIAVNGRQFNQRVIRTALREAKNSTEPIELLVKSGEYYKTHKIDYHEGEKYPWLERDDSRPDLLTNIISTKKPS